MKKITKILLILLSSLMIMTGCTTVQPDPNGGGGGEVDPPVIHRSDSGSGIIDYLYSVKQRNVVVSPVSINMALAMLLEGTNGNSQKELEEYLGYTKEEAKTVSRQLLDYLKQYIDKQTQEFGDGEKFDTGLGFVEIANSIWFKNEAEIRPEYQKLLREFFDATAESLDFKDPKSASIINKWVSDKTRGLINEIIDPDQLAELYMILINALYMKGSWAEAYGDRQPGKFNGKDADVLKCVVNEYFENDKAVAFSKSINGGFEMVAILPKAEGEFTLEELDLEGLLKTRSYDYDVYTSIPAFDVEFSENITDVLMALGIIDVFDPAVADLSDISDIKLFVSDVIHKTHVKVDENGFEGAAITAIFVKDTAVHNPVEREKKEVIIDRPFVFMILDRNTGTVIFTGKVITLDK